MEILPHTTAEDILREWLLENGYDGLYNEDDGCGCWAEVCCDFMPCCDSISACKPGYKIECNFHCGKSNPRPCIGPKGATCPEPE